MSESKQHSRNKDSSAKIHKVLRTILSFVLFILIVLTSFSVCAKAVFVNPETFINVFTDKEYIIQLKDDVLTYSYDLCYECAVPTDIADAHITYAQINLLEESFIAGLLGTSDKYNKSAFDENIKALNSDIVSSTKQVIKLYGVAVDKNLDENTQKFADKITDYIQNRIKLENIERLETITNIGNTATTVLIVVMAIISCVMASIIFFIGNRRYRSIRSIAYSFLSASLFSFIAVGAVEAVKAAKQLVIYPNYLCWAVMKYVGLCEFGVLMSGTVLFCLSIALISIVWKFKRDGK